MAFRNDGNIVAFLLVLGAVTLPLSSRAQWTQGVTTVDSFASGYPISSGTSINGGFRSGGWFQTEIGHESVAHDGAMPIPFSPQLSSWTEQHIFKKNYFWQGSTPPNGISFTIHYEVSGARSGGYADASSVITFNSQPYVSKGASSSYQSSYQEGQNTIFESSNTPGTIYTANWTSSSSASGGRPNIYGMYHAWAKTLIYTGAATEDNG
jgi:hypothetical protein